jgi:hypothetical protein
MMRALRLFTAVAASAVLAGCASTHAAGPAAPAPSTSAPAAPASPATAGAAAGSAAGGPSASASMVCSAEIKKDVATVLALTSTPATAATWTDHLYTCTYHLASGTLVLSVKESADTPSANAYYTTLQQQLGTTTPLTAAESLGNRGYQSAYGTVVVLKDDKTLKVDPTGLPAASGANRLSRSDVAYEIATDVLGCWNGD